jgi:hypothetical protein
MNRPQGGLFGAAGRAREVGGTTRDRVPSGAAPRIRCFTDDAPERTAEMRLIAHAAAQRDVAQRVARGEHQALRDLDAPAHDIGVGSHPEAALELTAEVTFAETDEMRQRVDVDLAGEIRVDMRRDSPDLPRCESTARSCLSRLAAGLHGCEPRTQFALEQSDGARDARLDRLAIAVQRATRRLDEVCRDYTESA